MVTADSGDVEPTGWRLVRELAAGFWADLRGEAQPVPVVYLRCQGCGKITARTRVKKVYRVTGGGIGGGTLESECGACEHVQPRVDDDEVPAGTTVVCTGHPHRRFGSKRSRRPCGRTIIVPRYASLVICPWCVTAQPGPTA